MNRDEIVPGSSQQSQPQYRMYTRTVFSNSASVDIFFWGFLRSSAQYNKHIHRNLTFFHLAISD